MTDKRKPPAPCTQAIFDEIIAALYQGTTLAQWLEIYKDNPDYPTRSAIMSYVNADNARKGLYALAREGCADSLAEQVVVASDSNSLDPQRARNRMTGRQWLAAKIKPKVYGDKLDLDITGRIDVSTAILAARKRAQLPDNNNIIDITPTDIQSDVLENNPPVDPFS